VLLFDYCNDRFKVEVIMDILMTKTKIALFAIPTCALLIAIGVLSVNFTETGLASNSDDTYSIQNQIIPQAYAEKPLQEIVLVDISSTEYGAGSTFDIEKVECKISTKNGETKVNWCKATGIMNKITLEACLTAAEACFSAFTSVLTDIFAEGADFDKALVEYEVEQLTDTIDSILASDYPGIIIPDYEEKSLELEMSVQNDQTSQTKVVVGIEY